MFEYIISLAKRLWKNFCDRKNTDRLIEEMKHVDAQNRYRQILDQHPAEELERKMNGNGGEAMRVLRIYFEYSFEVFKLMRNREISDEEWDAWLSKMKHLRQKYPTPFLYYWRNSGTTVGNDDFWHEINNKVMN